MDGAIVVGEDRWFVVIVDESVGKEKMASGSATYAFFTEIGHVTWQCGGSRRWKRGGPRRWHDSGVWIGVGRRVIK